MSGGKDEGSRTKGGLGATSANRQDRPATGQSAGGTEPMEGAGASEMPAAGQAASGTDAITPRIRSDKLGGASVAANTLSGEPPRR